MKKVRGITLPVNNLLEPLYRTRLAISAIYGMDEFQNNNSGPQDIRRALRPIARALDEAVGQIEDIICATLTEAGVYDEI